MLLSFQEVRLQTILDCSTLRFWLMLISLFQCDFVSSILIECDKYSSQLSCTPALARRILLKLPKIETVNFFENLKSIFWSHLTNPEALSARPKHVRKYQFHVTRHKTDLKTCQTGVETFQKHQNHVSILSKYP